MRLYNSFRLPFYFPSCVEMLHKLKAVTSLINRESSFTASKKHFTVDSILSGTVLQMTTVEYLQFRHQLLSLTGKKKKENCCYKNMQRNKLLGEILLTNFNEIERFLAF